VRRAEHASRPATHCFLRQALICQHQQATAEDAHQVGEIQQPERSLTDHWLADEQQAPAQDRGTGQRRSAGSASDDTPHAHRAIGSDATATRACEIQRSACAWTRCDHPTPRATSNTETPTAIRRPAEQGNSPAEPASPGQQGCRRRARSGDPGAMIIAPITNRRRLLASTPAGDQAGAEALSTMKETPRGPGVVFEIRRSVRELSWSLDRAAGRCLFCRRNPRGSTI